MSTGQKIKVTIDPCGRPTIEAIGFVGGSCKDKTKVIEDAFKGGQLKITDKPELYAVPNDQTLTLGI